MGASISTTLGRGRKRGTLTISLPFAYRKCLCMIVNIFSIKENENIIVMKVAEFENATRKDSIFENFTTMAN